MCSLGIGIYLWGYYYPKLEGKAHWRKCLRRQKWQEVALATQNLVSNMLVPDIPGLSVCHRHSTGTGTEDPDLINWLRVHGADETTINKVAMILLTAWHSCSTVLWLRLKKYQAFLITSAYFERLICFQRIGKSHECEGLHKYTVPLIVPKSDYE